MRLQLSVLAYNGGEPVAAAGAARSQELVADELAASVDENRRAAGQACPLLWLLLAEGHLNRKLFAEMLGRIWALRARRVTGDGCDGEETLGC